MERGSDTKETSPAWYELGVKDTKTLLIRIHTSAFSLMERIKENSPVVLSYKKRFSPGLFIEPKLGKSWGFEEILFPCKSDEKNWLVYGCKLPVVRRVSGKKTNAYALRCTLSVLFNLLWLHEENTDCKRSQLMIVEGLVVDNTGSYDGSISVTVTPTVSRWLSKVPDHSHLTEVEEAMMKADMYMWPRDQSPLYHHEFEALCRQPKWINFNIPGNACGLDPSDYYNESPNLGYRLSPHNTDSSLQQLTLLVGLAKLQDLIRKDML